MSQPQRATKIRSYRNVRKSISDPPLAIDLAPLVDPDHPSADRYRAASLQLESDDESVVRKGRDRLWRMLDDTKFMISVYQWLSSQKSATRVYLAKYYPRWCLKGWYHLAASAGEMVSEKIAIPIIHQAIRDHDFGGARLAGMIAMEEGTLKDLIRVAILEGSEQIARWFIRIYATETVARDVIRTVACQQSSLAVWQVALQVDPRPFGKGSERQVHPALIEYAIERKFIAPSEIVRLVVNSPVDRRELWNNPALLAILAQYQSDLVAEVVTRLEDHKLEQIQFITRLITDVHASDEFMFHSLLRSIDDDDGNYYNEHIIAILAWMIPEYQIDIFSRGIGYLFLDHDEVRPMLQECTRGQATKICEGKLMNCIISQTPLVSPGYEEYRIDHIYLYSSTMYLDAVAGCFVEGQWRKNEIERVSYASLGRSRVECLGRLPRAESSSSEEGASSEKSLPEVSEKKEPVIIHLPDQPDRDSPIVNAWLSYRPEQVVQIHLPRFLIPAMQASTSRKKSARSAVAH